MRLQPIPGADPPTATRTTPCSVTSAAASAWC
jgi:hypothetical protein